MEFEYVAGGIIIVTLSIPKIWHSAKKWWKGRKS